MPTTNPIPSQDPSDLLFNAEKLDEVVNGGANTFTDRAGVVRRTLAGLSAEFPNAAANAAAAAASATQAANEAESAATAVGLAFNEATAAQAARTGAEAARDAALIQSGVYATTAEGLAATAADEYFKVIGTGNVAAIEYRNDTSQNIFNAATIRDGFYINSADGDINSAPGWGCSDFIPVTAGQQYTLSGTRSRAGISFYSAASDTDAIAGSYTAGSLTAPTTVTAPAGSTHAVFNLYTATSGPVYSNNQFEAGASATPYSPFGTTTAIMVASYPSAASVSDFDPRIDALESQSASFETRASSLESSVEAIEASTSALPVNYVQNFLLNGDLENTPALWTYTGTSPIVSVAGVPELSSLGINSAYSIPTVGGTASQVRIENSLLTGMGVADGEHLLIGSFVYASDGVSFPASFASYSITVDGVTLAMDSTGFVQVSTNVRFLWAKKVVPAGSLTRIIIGFTSASLPANPATRLHSGFFVHKSTEAADTPTLATINRYLGWGGSGSSAELFAVLQQVADEYAAGTIGDSAYSPRLVLAGEGDAVSYVEVRRQGRTVRRAFRPFPVASKTASSVFDFRSDIVDGVTIKAMSDDAAPYRALGTTIGANHGYYMFSVPAGGHGKTQADIGSVYANGGVQWVIISIISADSLYIARRTDNASTVSPAGVYTHVSGGSNIGDITVTAAGTLAQLYPPFTNRVIQCLVDGVQISESTASLVYQREVAFVESYDILERADVIAWYEASGANGQIQPTGTPAISVSISYVFDHEGQCTIYTDFLARKNGIALSDIMFLQAQRMVNVVDGPVEYYIPKALPLTHAGISYDYANIDSTDTTTWTTRLDFTPARCEPTGILCDRVVQLSNNYGFALGYLPVQSTSIANRRSNATAKALQISNSSAKVYMSAIDKGNITLNAGDYFSTIAYRNIVLRTAARTSLYAVRTNSADYLYVDWHSATTDRVPVPTDFVGRDFEVVEKSANVSVLSQALTSNLIVSVSAAASYGYLILKVL